jgi:hypothetical protein
MHKSLRRRLQRYEGEPCPYCQVEMTLQGPGGANGPDAPSRDHIIPQYRTRRFWTLHFVAPWLNSQSFDAAINIQIVCKRCNEDKGHLTHDEYVAVRAGLASRLDKGDGERQHRNNANAFMRYGSSFRNLMD